MRNGCDSACRGTFRCQTEYMSGLSTIVKQVLLVKWCISSRSRIGSGKSRTGGGTEFITAESVNTVCCPSEDSGVEGRAEAERTVEPPSS